MEWWVEGNINCQRSEMKGEERRGNGDKLMEKKRWRVGKKVILIGHELVNKKRRLSMWSKAT